MTQFMANGQGSSTKVLTRRETMERLRLKAATFSKLTNGRMKDLPPLRCIRVGRRQLFLEATVDQWLVDAEGVQCNGAH
jgi:hypothetical protein